MNFAGLPVEFAPLPARVGFEVISKCWATTSVVWAVSTEWLCAKYCISGWIQSRDIAQSDAGSWGRPQESAVRGDYT